MELIPKIYEENGIIHCENTYLYKRIKIVKKDSNGNIIDEDIITQGNLLYLGVYYKFGEIATSFAYNLDLYCVAYPTNRQDNTSPIVDIGDFQLNVSDNLGNVKIINYNNLIVEFEQIRSIKFVSEYGNIEYLRCAYLEKRNLLKIDYDTKSLPTGTTIEFQYQVNNEYKTFYSKTVGSKIYLYNSTSEKNRLDKTNYLTNEKYIDGYFRNSISVLSPIITIESDSFITSNYCYIPNFGRYYYIDEIVCVRNNIYDLYCSVDVLMSHKEEIKELDCKVNRQEFNYAPYLVDNKLPISKEPQYFYESIETDFNPDKILNNQFSENIQDDESFRYVVNFVGDNVEDYPVVSKANDINDFNCPIIVSKVLTMKMIYELMNGDWKTDLKYLFNNPADGINNILLFPLSLTKALTNANGYDLQKHAPSGYEKIEVFKFGNVERAFATTAPNANNTPTVVILKGYRPSPNGGRFDGVLSLTYSKKINPIFNNFLDYSPYTSMKIYLPYFGELLLDNDIFLDNFITIKYNISLSTGMCNIIIKTDDIVRYTIDTRVGVEIPLGSSNQAEKARNQLMLAVKTAGTVVALASGMVSTEMVGASTVTKINRSRKTGMVTSITKTQNKGEEVRKFEPDVGAIGNFIGDTTVGAIQVSQNKIEGGSSQSGFLEFLSQQNIIITRTTLKPLEIPNYAHLIGRPSDFSGRLKELNGYTEVSACHMENFPNATQPEITEIENTIKSGFII